ncbi:hypothetical protein EXS71_00330 [Candidatus Uhrbacteria bacterium]|nr:hypothetical protein [Candidatus Uhrbacteria bacterium]
MPLLDLHPEKASSPCHQVALIMKMVGDVMVYYCARVTCQTAVARISPDTHRGEWLDGNDPGTMSPLRRMVQEGPVPKAKAASSRTVSARR